LISAGLLALIYRAVPAGRLRTMGGKVAATLIGFGLASGTAEIVLRKLRVDAYRLQPALLKWQSLVAPGAMRGVTGVSHFTTEAHGIRGEPYAADKYNILAIGGSTTENLYLDDRENWPYLVERKLDRTAQGRPVWIGNIGVSGQSSPHHLYALRYFVPQLRIDTVIVVVGVNDLIIGLNRPDGPMLDPEDPENRTALMRRTFKQIPLSAKPFPGNLATWSLVEAMREKLRLRVSRDLQDNRGDIFPYRRRLYWKLTKEIDRLPDLTSFLDFYEHNLIALIREARRQRVRLILATQPSIWHEPMSEESKRLLWMGVEGRWGEPEARFSVDVLMRGMALVNQRLLEVCAEQQVECVDLAGAMNGQEDFFFDDVHFTELGSRRVADLVVDYLAQRPPFASPRA
jgi:lysophospholipase L1-like esterase